jgi:hypothetical protein
MFDMFLDALSPFHIVAPFPSLYHRSHTASHFVILHGTIDWNRNFDTVFNSARPESNPSRRPNAPTDINRTEAQNAIDPHLSYLAEHL